MPQRFTFSEIDVYSTAEVDAQIENAARDADAKLAKALEQLVTQAALTAALANMVDKAGMANAISSAVLEAVKPLATKTEVEAAKAAAIRDATAGRPNWTETNKRLNDLLAPILARLAALEAR